MKKVFLPIAAVIIVLLVGAVFVKPSTVETPPKKQQKIISIPAQLSDDGKLITDREKWDENKGFFTAHLVVE